MGKDPLDYSIKWFLMGKPTRYLDYPFTFETNNKIKTLTPNS